MQEEGTGGSHPFTRYNFLEKVKLGEGKKQLVLPAGVLFLAKLATKAPRGNPLPQLELGMLLGGLSTPVCPGLGNCWAPGPDFCTKFTPPASSLGAKTPNRVHFNPSTSGKICSAHNVCLRIPAFYKRIFFDSFMIFFPGLYTQAGPDAELI